MYPDIGKFYLAVFVETFHFMLPSTIHKDKVKVKLTLQQATKAQRGSRDIAVLFL